MGFLDSLTSTPIANMSGRVSASTGASASPLLTPVLQNLSRPPSMGMLSRTVSVGSLRTGVERDLTAALPVLESLMDAVSQLTPVDLKILASFKGGMCIHRNARQPT